MTSATIYTGRSREEIAVFCTESRVGLGGRLEIEMFVGEKRSISYSGDWRFRDTLSTKVEGGEGRQDVE